MQVGSLQAIADGLGGGRRRPPRHRDRDDRPGRDDPGADRDRRHAQRRRGSRRRARRSRGGTTSTVSRISPATLIRTDLRVDGGVEDVGDQVAGEEDHASRDADPVDRRVVEPARRLDRVRTEAVPREHRLGEHRAREQHAEREPENRHDRRERVAQHVVAHHRALAESLRPGGAHVVGVQLVEHRRPDEPGDDAHQAPPEHERREHQLAQRLPGQAEVPTEQRVDRVQAGDLPRCVRARREAAGSGEPTEPGVQRVEQDQTEPEHGQRRADEPGDAGDVVDEPALVAGRHDAEDDAADGADEQRPERQLERGRDALPQVRRHRLAGPERRPEVAADEAAEELDVLLDDAAVEPPALAGSRDDALVAHLALADDRRHRVGRDDPGDDEGDRGDAEQQQRGGREAAEDVAQHRDGPPGRALGQPRPRRPRSRLQQAL